MWGDDGQKNETKTEAKDRECILLNCTRKFIEILRQIALELLELYKKKSALVPWIAKQALEAERRNLGAKLNFEVENKD